MNLPTRFCFAVVLLGLMVTSVPSLVHSSAAQEKKKPAPQLQTPKARAQREVRMLDDIYKSAIVAITTHYVNDEEAIPAGTAFKLVFAAAEKKGWHKVRLVDATGEPLEDENAPEDEFERKAMRKLVAGETWVETVETRKGTRHLRVATAIPVVSKKCIMCHDHYEDVPKGQAIGALTYILPLDGPLVTEAK